MLLSTAAATLVLFGLREIPGAVLVMDLHHKGVGLTLSPTPLKLQ